MEHKLLSRISTLARRKQRREVQMLLLQLDEHPIAQLLERLSLPTARWCFLLLPPEVQSDIALHLSPHARATILPTLPDDVLSRFLHFSSEDDATDLLQALPERLRGKVLAGMRPEKRKKIDKLLTFGAETAGGLMDLHFLTVDADTTVHHALRSLHAHTSGHGQSPMLIAADSHGHVAGYLPHRTLLFAHPKRRVRDLLQTVPIVHHALDREHVLAQISRSKSNIVCVVDDRQRPIGVIQLADLLGVASAEATEDVFRFAGVDAEEQPLDSVWMKVQHRYAWLLVNLGTAFLAASVVALFQNTITRLAILAVYMPIVAGQGGNAATQALAVVVRGLAVGDLRWQQARHIIARESLAGMLNGILTGFVAGSVAVAVGGPPLLGVVLGSAMIINLLVAGFFGALVPLILKWSGIDPAVASSIFVTTATDVFGFLAFLGLGSVLL
ncbi:MAG: magnesium transporter [Candidatus Peregrinibacteria bacterium Gr01-1014_25]|nr:MAG: magnesium transporter [Candidatus Peregrinibacteria bacterium Gr01-1014_25]